MRPYVGIGMYRGGVSINTFWWGYPRWWFPFGYGPYWYGPYWGGSYWGGSYWDEWGEEQGGSLKLEVKPASADVFVDGYFAGIVDDFDGFFQSLDVAPGNHAITLWCQGYRTVTQEVYVQRGNPLKLRYQMAPLAAGEPQDPRPMPPPESQAPLVRGDEPTQPDQLTPPTRPRQPREPRMPQQPAPPRQAAEPWQPAPPRPPAEPPQPARPGAIGEAPDYAQLAIKVQPAGAQVFIDGEAWQGSPGSDRLVVHLPVGLHHVEIRKEGFRTFKTDVQIRTGETTTLNVSLSGQDSQ